ncbi:glycoside hydrolase family 28 protein [Hortaea werneckii]|nr:glycoside hydrolase family 28 protein [Hortaea werneckii]KAI6986816.1 glycoside hydrolase family 28 protein [Hortaea werneckii]KAI7558053.1 glycoside hydrolase family 28 protein [Hortaea werneckii]KAI7659697.1 glycoside hydrolase family 28 protein [Hortaea werneckii]RMY26742.1 hypothetical protein D0866_10652 [Hortaea werneckii]
MKLLATFAAFTAAATAAVVPETFPAGSALLEARNAVPGGGRGRGHGHHHQDKWGCNLPDYRHKVTIRASQNETDDVSDDFLWAMHKANHGGTVWLKEGETYVIGKKLLLDFLKDIHVQLDGEILFTDDIEYWQTNNFYYDFQRSITFWVWGGEDIRIYGSGTLNGNAQRWWAEFQGRQVLDDDNTFYRPILFLTDNATRVDISGINFLNSPIWFNLLVRSKDVSYDNVYINAVSSNASVEPANSDGWDTLNTDGVSITNSRVNVGDDCYSAKPNSSNIFLQNLWCNGTHGISMGSIGQYPGELDIIENIYAENVTMLHSSNGARVKTWAGEEVGYGYVRNITWKDFYVEDVDWPIVLDACYFNIESEVCAQYPSQVNISDLTFENFSGRSSGANGDAIARLVCSEERPCENIQLINVHVTTPETEPEDGVILCDGIAGGVGMPCISESEWDGAEDEED